MSIQTEIFPASDPPRSGRPVEGGGEGDLSGESWRAADARGDMYRFLSAVYLSPPSPALIDQLLAPDFLEDLSTLFSREPIAELESLASASDGVGPCQSPLCS